MMPSNLKRWVNTTTHHLCDRKHAHQLQAVNGLLVFIQILQQVSIVHPPGYYTTFE